MWCDQCETDVAGIASPKGDSLLVCGKCLTVIEPDQRHTQSKTFEQEPILDDPDLGMRLDLFRMQSTLDRVDRLVERLQNASEIENDATVYLAEQEKRRLSEVEVPKAGFPFLATGLFAGGTTLLVCGSLLIGWGAYAMRPELVNLGFLIDIVAMSLMAASACFYFQHASQRQRSTQEWLGDVQAQLGELRQMSQESRRSLGSIPNAPILHASEQLVESERRLAQLRRRLSESRHGMLVE